MRETNSENVDHIFSQINPPTLSQEESNSLEGLISVPEALLALKK